MITTTSEIKSLITYNGVKLMEDVHYLHDKKFVNYLQVLWYLSNDVIRLIYFQWYCICRGT